MSRAKKILLKIEKILGIPYRYLNKKLS